MRWSLFLKEKKKKRKSNAKVNGSVKVARFWNQLLPISLSFLLSLLK